MSVGALQLQVMTTHSVLTSVQPSDAQERLSEVCRVAGLSQVLLVITVQLQVHCGDTNNEGKK